MFHLRQRVIVFFGAFVQISEVNTESDFSVFLPDWHKVSNPLRIPEGNDDTGIQQFPNFFLHRGQQQRIE
jgi:hypothetical protein